MEDGVSQVQVFTALRPQDLLLLARAAGRTMAITVIAVTVGTVLGCVFGWILSAGRKKAEMTLGALLDVFRSIPLLIQLILFSSFVPIVGFPLDPFESGTIVLSLYTSAYVASVARAGIDAVPPVTRRAARSLGMSYWQDMGHIVAPIGLRAVFPSWVGISLSVMKDSALVSVLGYAELLFQAQKLIVRTQEPLQILLIAGLFYFALSYPVSKIGERLERSWKES